MRGRVLTRILGGYVRILRTAGFAAALLAASAALGFLIAWPLWFFATTHRSAYTIFTLAAAAAGVILLSLRGALRSRAAPRGLASGARRRSPLVSAIFGALWLILFAIGLYLALLLISRGLVLLGVPVLLALLLLLGYLAFAPRRKKSPV
jgi:high-affinity Fe2+/Pb2+ permease